MSWVYNCLKSIAMTDTTSASHSRPTPAHQPNPTPRPTANPHSANSSPRPTAVPQVPTIPQRLAGPQSNTSPRPTNTTTSLQTNAGPQPAIKPQPVAPHHPKPTLPVPEKLTSSQLLRILRAYAENNIFPDPAVYHVDLNTYRLVADKMKTWEEENNTLYRFWMTKFRYDYDSTSLEFRIYTAPSLLRESIAAFVNQKISDHFKVGLCGIHLICLNACTSPTCFGNFVVRRFGKMER